MTNPVKISLQRSPHEYEIVIGANTLNSVGAFVRNSLRANARRVVVISNRKVFEFYGETVAKSLREADFETFSWLMRDGEIYKNLRSWQTALEFFAANKINRNDAVIALGGGVVGDLAGFAAASSQRGLDFIQIPTTLLAAIDSSVGGKTGVNADFGKNQIGAFHQPKGVFLDVATFQTLPQREIIAGFAEAVKHSIISGENLFIQTNEFLEKFPLKSFRKFFVNRNVDFIENLQTLMAANVAFKAEIVKGDELEDITRNDSRSRKILNFGHTVGHALETVTNYKRFKHGEAVALGMSVAVELSKNIGILSENKVDLIRKAVQSLGIASNSNDIETNQILAAFSHDKKAANSSFKWILLRDFGRVEIIDNKEIPVSLVRKVLQDVLQTRN